MSYARLSEGDIYVFLANSGYECMTCLLNGPESFPTTDAIIEHVRAHIAANHHVPDRCLAGLERDREQNDHFLRTGAWPIPQTEEDHD